MSDPALFKSGMRRLAAGVSIITTFERGKPFGMVATAVTAVSAEPNPTLLICVNQSASSHDAILNTGNFCVNVLRTEQEGLARLFGSSADRTRRFDACNWSTLATGAPALDDALACFDCKVDMAFSVHSHTVFIAKVLSVRIDSTSMNPLVYADGSFAAIRPVSLD